MRFHEARGIGPETIAEIQAQMRHRLLSVLARRGVLEREDAAAMGTGITVGVRSFGRCAIAPFSFDASVRIEADDRLGLERERLLRYCVRPAFALERLREIDAERLVYAIVKPGAGDNVTLILSFCCLTNGEAAIVGRRQFITKPSLRLRNGERQVRVDSALLGVGCVNSITRVGSFNPTVSNLLDRTLCIFIWV